MITARPQSYLESLAAELQSQSERVRNLIGNAHWLHDGRHKEHLLAEVVRRHLPSSVLATTGFVICPTQATSSREQDILVVDCSSEAPIFAQGGLAISFSKTVLAAVAVKTTFDAKNLSDASDTLLSVRRVAALSGIDPSWIWCGVYFFAPLDRKDDQLPLTWLRNLASSKGCVIEFNGSPQRVTPVDVVACAEDLVFCRQS